MHFTRAWSNCAWFWLSLSFLHLCMFKQHDIHLIPLWIKYFIGWILIQNFRQNKHGMRLVFLCRQIVDLKIVASCIQCIIGEFFCSSHQFESSKKYISKDLYNSRLLLIQVSVSNAYSMFNNLNINLSN